MQHIDYEYPITTKTLMGIIKSMKDHYKTIARLDIYDFWFHTINDYANEEIFFKDKSITSFYELFPLQYSIFNFNFTIMFDIQRILKFIDTNEIDVIQISSDQIQDDYYYTEMSSRSVDGDKKTNPVIIFLPGMHEGKVKSFAVIDGNHRVSVYDKDKKNFTFNYLDGSVLEFSCFNNLNSCILYRMLSCYFLTEYAYDDIDSIFTSFQQMWKSEIEDFLRIYNRNIHSY